MFPSMLGATVMVRFDWIEFIFRDDVMISENCLKMAAASVELPLLTKEKYPEHQPARSGLSKRERRKCVFFLSFTGAVR